MKRKVKTVNFFSKRSSFLESSGDLELALRDIEELNQK